MRRRGSLHVHYDTVIDENGEEKVILHTEMDVTYMSDAEYKKKLALYADGTLLASAVQYTGENENEGKTLAEMGPGGMPGVPYIPYINPKRLNYYHDLKIKNA